MIILKCIGPNSFYIEKVVMPTETHWFEAPETARLEIWEMSTSGQMLNLRADVVDYAVSEDQEQHDNCDSSGNTNDWSGTAQASFGSKLDSTAKSSLNRSRKVQSLA